VGPLFILFQEQLLKLLDAEVAFHEDASQPGKLIIQRYQEIPDSFVSMLKQIRMDSTGQREKNFMHAAAVPTSVHEVWMKRDGYDCTREPIRNTIRKLRAEGLDAFITTNKRV
jgi:hypothetical protein